MLKFPNIYKQNEVSLLAKESFPKWLLPASTYSKLKYTTSILFLYKYGY